MLSEFKEEEGEETCFTCGELLDVSKTQSNILKCKCGALEIILDDYENYSTARCGCGTFYYAEGKGEHTFNTRPRMRTKEIIIKKGD